MSEPPPRRLHEMNRLGDMARFPLVIYVGATANVLACVLLAWWVHGQSGGWFVDADEEDAGFRARAARDRFRHPRLAGRRKVHTLRRLPS